MQTTKKHALACNVAEHLTLYSPYCFNFSKVKDLKELFGIEKTRVLHTMLLNVLALEPSLVSGRNDSCVGY